MFETHRSNLNVEMTANKCGSGELKSASSQLNVARLPCANTSIIQTEMKSVVFWKPILLQQLDPLENFLGLVNAGTLWFFFALHLQTLHADLTGRMGVGGGGVTLRILTSLSPRTSASSIHYISSWPQVPHTECFCQALLIHLSTNLHRGPSILFSFNPRSRALAQHLRAFCQRLGFTVPEEDGEADGQHADTEADSWPNKRVFENYSDSESKTTAVLRILKFICWYVWGYFVVTPLSCFTLPLWTSAVKHLEI